MSTSENFSINTSKYFSVKKGFTAILALFGLIAIIVVAGLVYYYGYSHSQSTNTNNQLYVSSSSPSPLGSPPSTVPPRIPPPGLTSADIDLIKQAVAQKDGQPLSQLTITFDPNDNSYGGLYASGQEGPALGGGGAAWFAAKVNGSWVIVAITQAPIPCTDVNKYNLPKSMVSSCVDSSNNVISR